MKRILCAAPLPKVGTSFIPEPEQLHHIERVRRVGDGELLEILDGQGAAVVGRVRRFNSRVHIDVIDVLNANRESPLNICLALAIPTHRKTIDRVLPAVVQLGIHRFWLVETRFSGRLKGSPQKAYDRQTKIAGESLKQCGRLKLPEIEMVGRFDRACARMERDLEMNLIFHPTESEEERSEAATTEASGAFPWGGAMPDGLGLLIGPEGGFADDEVDLARSLGFWVSQLGPRVLRMETAVIGTCFWAQAVFGDLGSGIDGR